MPALKLGLGFASGPLSSSPPTLVLDTYSAAAAYSAARRLRTAYTGAAFRVRRSSDNVEQDIGFSGNAVDTAALTSFVGANSGFVVTWYDQSGNARDVTNADPAQQLRIVNTGVLEQQNSLPSLAFGASFSSHLRRSGAFLAAAGAMTAFIMARWDTTGTRTAFAEGVAANTATVYRFDVALTNSAMAVLFRNSASVVLLSNSALLNSAGGATLRNYTWKDTGSAVTAYQGLTAGTPAAYTRSGTLAPDTFAIGADFRSGSAQQNWSGGWISEAIFFTSALSDTDREAITNNQVAAFP